MLPSIALTVFVVLWSGIVGVVIHRMLGVSIGSVNGRQATFTDEMLIHGLGGAFPATILNCLLLFALFVRRIAYRWWIVAAFLILPGTPIALYSGWRIADHLWGLNQGGTAWEAFAPQMIGLALAWIVYVPIAIWLSRYRFVIVKRDDSRKSPCPRCGYDLYGSAGACPECGWQLPAAFSANGPPNRQLTDKRLRWRIVA